jgi:hypothetical protein
VRWVGLQGRLKAAPTYAPRIVRHTLPTVYLGPPSGGPLDYRSRLALTI